MSQLFKPCAAGIFTKQALARYGSSSAHEGALSSVVMVGANIAYDNQRPVLMAGDDVYMHKVLEACAKKGIRFSDQLAISVCNLDYGSDFLLSKEKSDILVLCDVFFNKNINESNRLGIDFFFKRQSPLAHVPGIWNKCINEHGVKVIGNFTLPNFSGAYFRDALQIEGMVSRDYVELSRDYITRGNRPHSFSLLAKSGLAPAG